VTFAKERSRQSGFGCRFDRELRMRSAAGRPQRWNEPVLGSLRPIDKDRTELLFHTPTGRHAGAGHAMLAARMLRSGADRPAQFKLGDEVECVVAREGSRHPVPWAGDAGHGNRQRDVLGAALGISPAQCSTRRSAMSRSTTIGRASPTWNGHGSRSPALTAAR